ncbi:hypothetical protein [Arcobacter vandammei]|uniref:hypothetical protein n=1 Tax=Arcobacter vandammei TaxID=2782243 RepID=UPI0018DF4FA3|nr:hypothetical protein [Arcobacter vandammei]
MILKKIIIKDQKELYRHKNYLLSLDLEFDSVKKEYSNNSELELNIELELIDFLKHHEFKFSFVEDEINDSNKIILASYKTVNIDENSIFIIEKKSNKKLYLIHKDEDKILIIDLVNELVKSYKSSRETNKLSIETLRILASNQDDFKELFSIFSILENQNKEDLLLLDRLKKFKYFCISKVKEQQKDMFLCNCVTGFFPETSFYIKGDRIFSDYTGFLLPFDLEFKVWKYLYHNRNFIGIYKEPSLQELFFGRKIYTLDEFSQKVKRLIVNARFTQNNLIQITLSNGITTQKVSKEFTKEELLKRVIEARD